MIKKLTLFIAVIRIITLLCHAEKNNEAEKSTGNHIGGN